MKVRVSWSLEMSGMWSWFGQTIWSGANGFRVGHLGVEGWAVESLGLVLGRILWGLVVTKYKDPGRKHDAGMSRIFVNI